jgi:hypothetical protein
MANDASPWPTVTLIGVLCGITFGLVLYSLLRRQDGAGAFSALPDGLGGGLDALPPALDMGSLGKPQPLSAARSLTLSETPTMVLRATGNCNWKVTVRVLSPISTFARFSVGRGSTDSIIVPAGSSQDLWVPAGQYLYASGSTAGVCISASGGRG